MAKKRADDDPMTSSLTDEDVLLASLKALGIDRSQIIDRLDRAVYDAAVEICRETGQLPTYDQIASRLKTNRKRVQYWVLKAEDNGLVRRVGRGPNNVRIVPLVAR